MKFESSRMWNILKTACAFSLETAFGEKFLSLSYNKVHVSNSCPGFQITEYTYFEKKKTQNFGKLSKPQMILWLESQCFSSREYWNCSQNEKKNTCGILVFKCKLWKIITCILKCFFNLLNDVWKSHQTTISETIYNTETVFNSIIYVFMIISDITVFILRLKIIHIG